MPKAGDFLGAIAAETGLKQKDIKSVLDATIEAVAREVKKNRVCKIPRLATLKMTTKRARAAGTRTVFGKEAQGAASPAPTTIKAYVSKQLRDAIRARS